MPCKKNSEHQPHTSDGEAEGIDLDCGENKVDGEQKKQENKA